MSCMQPNWSTHLHSDAIQLGKGKCRSSPASTGRTAQHGTAAAARCRRCPWGRMLVGASSDRSTRFGCIIADRKPCRSTESVVFSRREPPSTAFAACWCLQARCRTSSNRLQRAGAPHRWPRRSHSCRHAAAAAICPHPCLGADCRQLWAWVTRSGWWWRTTMAGRWSGASSGRCCRCTTCRRCWLWAAWLPG